MVIIIRVIIIIRVTKLTYLVFIARGSYFSHWKIIINYKICGRGRPSIAALRSIAILHPTGHLGGPYSGDLTSTSGSTKAERALALSPDQTGAAQLECEHHLVSFVERWVAEVVLILFSHPSTFWCR